MTPKRAQQFIEIIMDEYFFAFIEYSKGGKSKEVNKCIKEVEEVLSSFDKNYEAEYNCKVEYKRDFEGFSIEYIYEFDPDYTYDKVIFKINNKKVDKRKIKYGLLHKI